MGFDRENKNDYENENERRWETGATLMGWRARLILCFCAGCMFLGLVALALETGAAGYRCWTENHNLLILKGNIPVRVASVAGPFGATCTGAGYSDSPRLAGWAMPRASESRGEMEARRSLFSGLGPDDREVFALAHDEIVLALDDRAEVVDCWGNWLYRHPYVGGTQRHFLDALRQALTANKTLSGKLPSYLKVTDDLAAELQNVKEVWVTKQGPGLYFAFMAGDYRTMRVELPDDTPWDGTVPFFKYKKNLRNARSGLGTVVDTNNLGFRDDDVADPKPASKIRIVCVGGSTTEEGSTTATTYPNVLEKKLNAALACGNRIEVVNCGIAGLTTSGHLARVTDYLALEPDLIVVYEGVNDIHQQLVDAWQNDAPACRKLLRHSRFMALAADGLLYPGDDEMRRDIRDLSMANLRVLGRIALAAHVHFGLCSIACPDPGRIPAEQRQYYDFFARSHAAADGCLSLAVYRHVVDLFNEEVRKLCQEEGFMYFPVAEHMQGGNEVFSDIYHMNDAGIAWKAGIIAECLEPRLRPRL